MPSSNLPLSFKEVFLVALALALVSHNLFFETYREMVFNITPHDHYYEYANQFLGLPNGAVPNPTHGFRFLAVLLTIPLYFIVPVFSFSGIDGQGYSDEYLKMLIAFALMTFLCIVITSTAAYAIARKHFKATIPAALLVLLSMYIMLHHLREGLYGVDAMGVMMLSLVILFMDNRWLYTGLLILSVFINEKVTLILFMMMGMRWLIYKPHKIDIYLIAPTIGVLIYLAANLIAPNIVEFSGGNEDHRDVGNFLSQFMETFVLNFTVKGFILNTLPIILVTLLFLMARKGASLINTGIYFKPSDIVAFLGLLLVVHLVNVDFNVGRLIMYVLPIYLPLAVLWVYTMTTRKETGTERA